MWNSRHVLGVENREKRMGEGGGVSRGTNSHLDTVCVGFQFSPRATKQLRAALSVNWNQLQFGKTYLTTVDPEADACKVLNASAITSCSTQVRLTIFTPLWDAPSGLWEDWNGNTLKWGVVVQLCRLFGECENKSVLPDWLGTNRCVSTSLM